jgi:TRAP-type C4-dicarboxylate transport system permease small subunit
VVTGAMYWISCAAILVIVFVTVLDVILRRFGTPIDFAFEVVLGLAGIVIGFALPRTSLERFHVAVEYIDTKFSARWLRRLEVSTRLLGITLFAVIGWNACRLGNHLYNVGQASAVLQIPEFPFAYSLGFCCFVECLVLFYTLSSESREGSL